MVEISYRFLLSKFCSRYKVWVLHMSQSGNYFNPKPRSRYCKQVSVAYSDDHCILKGSQMKNLILAKLHWIISLSFAQQEQCICSSFIGPERCFLSLSQLKPVAACSLGHPETGETFVITRRDAGDATCLLLSLSLLSARLLGNAVSQLLGYVSQKVLKLYKAKRLF